MDLKQMSLQAFLRIGPGQVGGRAGGRAGWVGRGPIMLRFATMPAGQNLLFPAWQAKVALVLILIAYCIEGHLTHEPRAVTMEL